MPVEAKSKWQAIFWSRWFLFIALIVASFVVFAFGRAYYRDYQVRKEITDLQNVVKRLEAKKIETMEVLKFVQSPDFIEQKARTELNLIKVGEQAAIIPNIAGVKIGQQNDNMLNFKNLSNPIKWINYFLHKN